MATSFEMVAPPEPVNEIVPENIPLDIVYEDDHFLALNKQADLIIHPRAGRWHGTLVNGLVHYGKKWSTINGEWRPGILHRLDRNTTGIMLVAKSDEAHWRLARQFENRTIQKTYMAICHGVPELLGDVIDMPIGKDKYVREKQAVRKEEAGGKPAVTKYQVMENFHFAAEGCRWTPATMPADRNKPHPPAEVQPDPAVAQDRADAPASRAHDGHRLSRWSATRSTAGGACRWAIFDSPGRRCMRIRSGLSIR